MTALRDFGDMMFHTVLIAPRTGQTRFNQPTYGSNVTHKAVVVDQVQMVRDHNGEQVVSNTAVYLDGSPARTELALESRITLPDGKAYPILSISRYPDEHGDYVAVVYL
jgi:hypothetical protein